MSFVRVLGHIWQPGVGICSMEYSPSSGDLDSMKDEDGKITREAVETWVKSQAGDFHAIEDFMASLEVGEDTLEFEWKNEDSEAIYTSSLCMA